MVGIVVLVGGNRKGGNTYALAGRFAEGASENNDVDIIPLSDYKVDPCTGCNRCFDSNHRCWQEDDIHSLYSRMSAADVIVVVSPMFYFSINPDLKSIVDRLHNPICDDFRIRKLALLLSEAAELSNTFDAILIEYKPTSDYLILENLGSVPVRGGSGERILDEAYSIGLSFK